MSKIPLRNKKGEIIDYTTVSPEDFEHLNQFKWCKSDGYVKGNGNYRLHRYIKIEILKETILENYIVDHQDRNPLNNQRSNLRIITYSENTRNRKKKENCTSKYIGVSRSKKYNKFEVRINLKDKLLWALYNNEIHAAYQYNLWIDEYNLEGGTKNVIEIPQDFVQHVSNRTLKQFPTGITKIKSGKFRVQIYIDKIQQHLGVFATLDKAVAIRKEAETKRDIMFKERLLTIPKTFNEKNQCIFKIKDIEVIIDEELFYDIIKYTWCISDKGYIIGTPNGKKISLSRYIMNYDGNLHIDHINNNRLNNCKNNLRLVTPQENSWNRTSAKNSSSQYVGVHFIKGSKKWLSQIMVNGKKINIGRFTNEIEAAKARDKATLEHFGTIGNLNFPESIL